MTPENIRERGDELISKFRKAGCRSFEDAETHSAIQSSIIAVEEIIKELSGYGFIATDSQNEYWNEVLNYLKSKL